MMHIQGSMSFLLAKLYVPYLHRRFIYRNLHLVLKAVNSSLLCGDLICWRWIWV
jgi:hypothetical protein